MSEILIPYQKSPSQEAQQHTMGSISMPPLCKKGLKTAVEFGQLEDAGNNDSPMKALS